MPLLIVRHAHAGNRNSWTGDDTLRPVSARGRGQAIALVPVLTGYGPTRILSSPFKRCMETVAPLSASLGVPVEETDALAEGNGPGITAFLEGLVGTSVVCCTHGDVAAALWEDIGEGEWPGFPKGSLWVVDKVGGNLEVIDRRRLP